MTDHDAGFANADWAVSVWFDHSVTAWQEKARLVKLGILAEDDHNSYIYLKVQNEQCRGFGFYDEELGTMAKLVMENQI